MWLSSIYWSFFGDYVQFSTDVTLKDQNVCVESVWLMLKDAV